MYLLYLDDSGSAKNINEEHFVLGGICVHENKIFYLNQHLDELATQIDPSNPQEVEFHASHIYAGKPPFNKFDKPKRKEIIKNVLRVMNREPKNICVFACAVHKKSFPGQDPVHLAFEDLCSRFNLFLERIYHQKNESHRGIIIFDESGHEKDLQKLATNFRHEGTRWRVTHNLQEVPLFVNSKASRLIQLADHISYSIFRRYEAGDLNYYNVMEKHFDAEGARIHGLAHKQFYSETCTCPSCLLKRISWVAPQPLEQPAPSVSLFDQTTQ